MNEQNQQSEHSTNTERRLEDALQELEAIVQKLEQGQLPLEDSLAYCTKAWELANFCEEKLNATEKKLEILRKKNEREAEFVEDQQLIAEIEHNNESGS